MKYSLTSIAFYLCLFQTTQAFTHLGGRNTYHKYNDYRQTREKAIFLSQEDTTDTMNTSENIPTSSSLPSTTPSTSSSSSSSSSSGSTASGQSLKQSSTCLEKLRGSKVQSVKTNELVDLSTFLQSGNDKSMLILGTYAADFNAIEYVQRLRYYLPELMKRGITHIGLVLNCEPDAAKKLVEMLDLPTDATRSSDNNDNGDDDTDAVVQLFVDPKGEAGRAFGVERGWRPEDANMSPYLKLFGMLWGLGAWATLPAVIGGYIGNPFYGQPWIEDALAVGQRKNRWPNNALELDDETGQIKVNKFKELPYVGGWERRPLELATLRLQNMVDVSIKHWKDLAPTSEALEAGVLTQLGAVVVVDGASGKELFRWRDPGICAVANFEDILKEIPIQS